MRVSRREFNQLLAETNSRVRRRADFRLKERELILGLALRVALEREGETDRRLLKAETKSQAQKYGIGIGEMILSAIVAKIVELVVNWLIDQIKNERLRTVSASEDAYLLPELKP